MALATATQAALAPLALLPRKVLIVDPELHELYDYAHYLSQQNFDVRACGSYAEALRWLDVDHFDFVLLDQGSPRFEGRVILERILETGRRVPALVITRCLDMNCYLEAMQLGAVDYLEKPLPASKIADMIESSMRWPQRMYQRAGAA